MSTKTANKTKTRVRKAPRYKSFKLSKRITTPRPRLPVAWRIFGMAVRQLANHWRLFGGITLIYAVLTIVFVRGIGGGVDVQGLKNTLTETLKSQPGVAASSSVALFGFLLGSANTTSSGLASAYQTFLLMIVSLAVIWALRGTQADKTVARLKVCDAFYKGTAPLVTFIVVLVVISVQLLPLAVANFLYTNLIVGGLAVGGLEKTIWILLMLLLVLLSLYMLASSLFALYIITLPNMTPLKALRSARQLVLHRRLEVVRKLLFMIVILFAVVALIVIPAIMFVPVIAEWVLFACTMLLLPVVHSYMYTLYRKLL